jgi:hypothetical protein
MKRFMIVAAVCLVATSAFADQYRYYPRYHYHDNGAAIGLGIIGGLIVGGMLLNHHHDEPTVICWNKRFIDQYGREYYERVCDRTYDHESYE